MHSIQTIHLENDSLPNAPVTRMMLSMAIAACVTIGLFAFMHYLIKQDPPPIIKEEPFVFISSILDVEETKTVVQNRPDPMPKLTPKPETQKIEPIVPDTDVIFSDKIEIPRDIDTDFDTLLGSVDQQPRPTVRVPPSYPGPAAAKGIEGFVKLSFSVSSSGSVEDISIIESEPRNIFDRAATKALRKWRYQPKLVNGTPVGMSGLQVRLDFTLNQD